MDKRSQQILVRIVVHGLLAVFLANAANKFFVVDLDYELEHHFYGRIFEGVGDAPDQYRILPLLPLKFLTQHLSFNYSVLIYNTVLGFLVFELFWWIMGGVSRNHKLAFNVLFAGAYIYTQYTGWRPDTMGLVFLCALLASPFLVSTGSTRVRSGAPDNSMQSKGGQPSQDQNTTIPQTASSPMPAINPVIRAIGITLLLTAIAFSRADIAMVFALWLAIYQTRNGALILLWLAIPPATQFLLQEIIYPDASYYSDKIMLLDNLRGYYLLRHPATYLILALLIAFWRPILGFFRRSWDQKWFYLLCLGYLGLVLVVGRLNEYRLYLPFVPIFLVIWREYISKHGTTTDPV